MERSREQLKSRLSDPVLRDMVDTMYELYLRAKQPNKAATTTEAQDTVTVVNPVAQSIAWGRVTGKPSTFPPDPHTHSQYLTAETDPTVPDWVKGISESDIDRWNAPVLNVPGVTGNPLGELTIGGSAGAYHVVTPAFSVRLFETADFLGESLVVDVPSQQVPVPMENARYYLCAQRTGTAVVLIMVAQGDVYSIDMSRTTPLWRLEVHSGAIHQIGYNNAGDGLPSKQEFAQLRTQPYRIAVEGGLWVTLGAGRSMTMGGAEIFFGHHRKTLTAFNSATDSVHDFYHVAGVWSDTHYASGWAWPNSTYDNGTGIVAMGNNKWGAIYVYRSVGDDREVFVVRGGSEANTLEAARLIPIPATPDLIAWHCVLVGRILFQKDASTGVFEPYSTATFSRSQVVTPLDIGAEPYLGLPAADGYHLSSTAAGVRSWVAANAHTHAISDVTGLQASLDDKLSVSVSRSANTVYAAPNGSAGAPSFRILAAADIPNLDTSKLTSGTIGYARGGTGISAPGATAGNLRWNGSAYTIDTASYALASAIPAASSTTPAALGTAAVGTGTTWARADHVHAMPTAAQVGAEPALSNPSVSGYVLSSTAAGVRSWVALPAVPVASVFGRTGSVVAASGDYSAYYLGISATAVAATKLATARTLTVGATGKAFDGTADVSWTLAEIGASSTSHTHSSLTLYGAAPTSATAPSGFAPTAGMSFSSVYSQDYPSTYGNIINVRAGGGNQIFLGWAASDAGAAGMWIRNKRDAYDGWSPWQSVYTSSDFTVTAFAKTLLDDADAASVRATIGAQAALTNPVTGSSTSGYVAIWSGATTQTGYSALSFDGASTLSVGNGSTTASPIILLNGTSAAASYPNINFASSGISRIKFIWDNTLDALTVISRADDGSARNTSLLIPRTTASAVSAGGAGAQPWVFSGNVTALPLAGGSIRPLVSSTAGLIQAQDAATFRATIGAQAALTNPVTGTGAIDRVSVWSGPNTQTSYANFTATSHTLRFGNASPTTAVAFDIIGASTQFAGISFTIDNVLRNVMYGHSGIMFAAHDSSGNYIDAPFSYGNSSDTKIYLGGNNRIIQLSATWKGSLVGADVSGGISQYSIGSASSKWTDVYGYNIRGDNGFYSYLSATSINNPAIEVSGSGGANLPTGASAGTHLYYTGRITVATDTVTIPSGETVWYRSSDGSTSALVGPTTLNVNRRLVHLVKFASEWRIVGLYN